MARGHLCVGISEQDSFCLEEGWARIASFSLDERALCLKETFWTGISCCGRSCRLIVGTRCRRGRRYKYFLLFSEDLSLNASREHGGQGDFPPNFFSILNRS